MSYSPVTGQAIDINRFGGRGGGSRVPMSSGPGFGGDSWQGGRTPMAAASSSRTPAWKADSGRSKSADPPYIQPSLTKCSTRLVSSSWFAHPCVESRRCSHRKPLRRQPHSLRRPGFAHARLGSRHKDPLWRFQRLRHQLRWVVWRFRLRCLRGWFPYPGIPWRWSIRRTHASLGS